MGLPPPCCSALPELSRRKHLWVFPCLSVNWEGPLASLHDDPKQNAACSLSSLLLVCPGWGVQWAGWGKPKVVQMQPPPRVVPPPQLPYPPARGVPTSPSSSPRFSLSTSAVLPQEGRRRLRTAEWRAASLKAGAMPLAHRATRSSEGLHVQPAARWAPQSSFIPPRLLITCTRASSPAGCGSASRLLLRQPLPGGPGSSQGRSDMFWGPFTSFWKGSRWMIYTVTWRARTTATERDGCNPQPRTTRPPSLPFALQASLRTDRWCHCWTTGSLSTGWKREIVEKISQQENLDLWLN